MFVPVDLPPFRFGIGSTPPLETSLAMPVLAGEDIEHLFVRAETAGRVGHFSLYRQPGWLIGVASYPVATGLDAATSELYRDLMIAARGRHLARIWNCIPAINAVDPSGLENYRVFCRGRSLAFEREFGAGFSRRAPAASGVGCEGGHLVVVFAACDTAPRHIENPFQVPAYDYPAVYGPRAPTFARATIVDEPTGRTVFISGTSAIRGHATVAPHHTAGQVACTVANLREVTRACGLGSELGLAFGRAQVRVFLRHAADQPAVAELLAAEWPGGPDRIAYLRADICRPELNVEIEATIECPPG